MNKIPTIFERDWDGDRSRVLDIPTPGCEWVFAGDGVAIRKYDGTCCLVRDGKLYKRHEVKPGKDAPDGFEALSTDEETGKTVGWIPVGDGPEDRWHRETFAAYGESGLCDGTYELIGPKIQGNPEHSEIHRLIRHTDGEAYIVPRTYDGIRDMLSELDVEGFVFHHPDGRMAKIKGRDFGIKRSAVPT